MLIGRVRRVGYRRHIRSLAQALGLKGWVRNQDGAVVALAQGPKRQLIAFVHKLQRGPWLARPSQIEVEWSTTSEPLASFKIDWPRWIAWLLR